MHAIKTKKKHANIQLQSVSGRGDSSCACSDYLFDVSIALEEITGTVAVLAQLGVMRKHDAMTTVDLDDLAHCLCMLERRLKEVRDGVLSAMSGLDQKHAIGRLNDSA